MENATSDAGNKALAAAESAGVVARIARVAVAAREQEYAAEVRNLLDAGLAVIRAQGTTASPRVADIVKEAGVSNGVFYRHFQGKDELVYALLERGTERFRVHLAGLLGAQDNPRQQVRLWVEAILGTASSEMAAADLRAVLWNGARMSDDSRRRSAARRTLASVLHEPLRLLGSSDPEADSGLIAHAALGRLEDFLWNRQLPTSDDIARVVSFCLRAASASTPTQGDIQR
jgi:AcrR family transcriptional regulator